MAVTPGFVDELRARITLSDLVGRRVKLVAKGSRLTGLCPFHTEKTPSFHVNDAEGFYHCFGCGTGGDMISWLRETEGLEFMEAVRQLAEMAGLPMPAHDELADETIHKRKAAVDACEAAAKFFTARLASAEGAQASRYLAERGLSDEVIREFSLGYAPYKGLFAYLQQSEIPAETIREAGLIGRSDHDEMDYDYFRDRVMFPIEDMRGRVIGFGARALGDKQPKYLNSPESPAFSKKSVLYGWAKARSVTRRGLPLMVVEGYMDVIAVASSGVAAAVAPLGTALGEEQIRLLWKLADEPVLCFDGDKAGQAAALRAIERALPLLEPGRSVRLAALPEGRDPDDILRSEGADGLQRLLSTATGLLDSLWAFKVLAYQLDNPHTQAGTRAAFWREMRALVRTISHNQTRTAWADDLELRIATMRGATRGGVGKIMPTRRRPRTGRHVRCQAVLALLVSYPEFFDDYAEQLALLDFKNAGLEGLKNALANILISDPDLDVAGIKHHLENHGHGDILEQLFGADMTARFGKAIDELEKDQAQGFLNEMMGRLVRPGRHG